MKTRLPVAIALVSAIVLAAAQPLQAQPRSSSGCFNISGFYMDADDSDLYSDFAGVSMKIGIYITDTTELFGECMFGDALDTLRDPAAQPDPATACMLRLLLIHEYRRLMLRDPDLPAQLLPADWPGQAARMLCKEIYRRLLAPSEQHLDELFQLADGTTPPTLPGALSARFRDPDPLSTYGLAASP